MTVTSWMIRVEDFEDWARATAENRAQTSRRCIGGKSYVGPWEAVKPRVWRRPSSALASSHPFPANPARIGAPGSLAHQTRVLPGPTSLKRYLPGLLQMRHSRCSGDCGWAAGRRAG